MHGQRWSLSGLSDVKTTQVTQIEQPSLLGTY
jgi:hypothetical protein